MEKDILQTATMKAGVAASLIPDKINLTIKHSWMWWHTPGTPAFRRLRQQDHMFKASLECIVRSCLKKKRKVLLEIKKDILQK
jgi:hypothetical protein